MTALTDQNCSVAIQRWIRDLAEIQLAKEGDRGIDESFVSVSSEIHRSHRGEIKIMGSQGINVEGAIG